MATTKPNILIILADDIGVDSLRINPTTHDVSVAVVAPGGATIGPRPLPNLKRLVKAGVNFTRAWAQPVCSPTRASLFTGLQPWQTGVGYPEPVGNSTLRAKTSKAGDVKSLAESLKTVGYQCGMFGKWHLGQPAASQKRTPTQWGWDRFEGIYVGGFGPTIQDYGYQRGQPMTLATLASPPPNDGTRTSAEQTALATRVKNVATACRSYLTQVCPDFVDAQPDIRFYVWQKNIEDKATAVTKTACLPTERTHMYATLDQITSARAWIKTMGSTPWFAALTLTAPHDPFHVPPKGTFTMTFANPQAPTLQEMFIAMVESMDYYIGQLLDSPEPEVQAQLKSTVILFAGDNGTADTDIDTDAAKLDNDLKDKGTHFIGGVHVPMIIADGGALYGGAPFYLKSAAGASQVNVNKPDIVHITDVFKTVLDIAGAAPTVPGEEVATKTFSLKPYLTGVTPAEKRTYSFSQQFPHDDEGEVGKFAVIVEDEFKCKLACVRTTYVDGKAGDQYTYKFSMLKPLDATTARQQETAIADLLDLRYVGKVIELHNEMKKHRLDAGSPDGTRAPLPFPALPAAIFTAKKVRLKSLSGDYLHRPDTATGVTTYSTGTGNEWLFEPTATGHIRLKSWKSDYLLRLDQVAGGVTSGPAGAGLASWVAEPTEYGTIRLRSIKGDYLIRPEGAAPGVTTGGLGSGGQWTIELVT